MDQMTRVFYSALSKSSRTHPEQKIKQQQKIKSFQNKRSDFSNLNPNNNENRTAGIDCKIEIANVI